MIKFISELFCGGSRRGAGGHVRARGDSRRGWMDAGAAGGGRHGGFDGGDQGDGRGDAHGHATEQGEGQRLLNPARRHGRSRLRAVLRERQVDHMASSLTYVLSSRLLVKAHWGLDIVSNEVYTLN